MPDINTFVANTPAPQSAFLSDEAKRRLLAAQLLQKQAADAQTPVYSTGAGLAKLGAGLIGGMMEGYTEKQEGDLNKANAAAIGQWLQMNAAGGAPASAPSPGPAITSAPLPPPASVIPNDSNATPGTVGMNTKLANAVDDFIDDNPGTRLSSGKRSNADQARLYANRGSNPNPVAPPGTSLHEKGMAADIAGMTPEQRAMLPQYGLAQPVANDPVHVQLATDPAALPVNAQPTAGGPSPQAIASALQAPAPAAPNRMALAAQLLSDPRTPPAMRALIMSQVGPKDPIHLKEGESLLDPRTYNPIATGPEKKTSDQQNYDAAVKGGYTGSFTQYQLELKRAGATAITNDMRGESSFSSKAGEAQAKRFDELAADGQAAKQMVSDVQTLTELGKKIGTGKTAEAKAALGPYAEALGIKVDGLSDIQAYNAIVNRVAPTLRVKGSGAQSDFELKNFMKSLPALGNTEEGNAIAAQVLTGLQENKIRAAEIGSKALSGEISRSEAEKQLRDLPDPMTNYREYMKSRTSSAPATGQVRKYNPTTGRIE